MKAIAAPDEAVAELIRRERPDVAVTVSPLARPGELLVFEVDEATHARLRQAHD